VRLMGGSFSSYFCLIKAGISLRGPASRERKGREKRKEKAGQIALAYSLVFAPRCERVKWFARPAAREKRRREKGRRAGGKGTVHNFNSLRRVGHSFCARDR